MLNKYAYDEFNDIYSRQAERVFKLCCIYLGNEQDAQDAMHSVFVKMFEKNIRFKNQNHEAAWFCLTAKNYCYDILKSSWRKKRANYEELEKQDNATITGMSSVENRIIMREALSKIPIKQREVLYLYYYEEMSVKEISILLKRKESTILSQLAAGRKKLRKILEK